MHRKTDTKLIRRIILVVSTLLLVCLVVYSCFSCFPNDSYYVATPDEASNSYVQSENTSESILEPTTESSPTPTKETETEIPESNTSSQKKKKDNKQQKQENEKRHLNSKKSSSSLEYNDNYSSDDSYYSPTEESQSSQNSNPSDEIIVDGEFI